MSTVGYLTAIVGGDAFGIALECVRDLSGIPALKPLPGAGPIVRGL